MLEGARSPKWVFTLLSSGGVAKHNLTVKGGSLELSAQTRLGGSGELTISSNQEIDWLNDRVRLTYDPGVAGVEPWHVATMLFSSPKMVVEPGGKTWQVELLPVLAVVDEDTLTTGFTVPAGANIIDTVRELLAPSPLQLSVTNSDLTSRGEMFFQAGESKLTVCNELLQAVNYWGLHTDGLGRVLIAPYSAPGRRASRYRFAQGALAVHSPFWEREQDISSVPNRVVVRANGTGDNEAIIGIASLFEGSPYSFSERGRWVTVVDDVSDVSDQASADALAERKLGERLLPVGRVKAESAVLPLRPNQVVEFSDSGHDVKATIQKLGFKLTWDTQMFLDLREIINA